MTRQVYGTVTLQQLFGLGTQTFENQTIHSFATFHFAVLASLFLSSSSSSCPSPLRPPPLPPTLRPPRSPRSPTPSRCLSCRCSSPSCWPSPTLEGRRERAVQISSYFLTVSCHVRRVKQDFFFFFSNNSFPSKCLIKRNSGR